MSGSQFLETLGKLPLHYQPGTMWDYSFGLEVTGLAVEAVTKQRLGDFLQARLFAPLGMVDTQFVVPAVESRADCQAAATRSRHRGGTNVQRTGQAVAVRLRWRLCVRNRARLHAIRA